MTGYATVTEIPGAQASAEQLARMAHRYAFAVALCAGKDVLEVACGAGLGLGALAKVAGKVVGGDIDESLVALARAHYAGRPKIEIHRLDAHQLPFPDQSFDVVLLFEAIYYLASPEKFLAEASGFFGRKARWRSVRSTGSGAISTPPRSIRAIFLPRSSPGWSPGAFPTSSCPAPFPREPGGPGKSSCLSLKERP